MFRIVNDLKHLRAIAACAMLASGTLALPTPVSAQGQAPAPAQGQDQTQDQAPLSAEEIDQLVAPIALYPDSLLAQVLTASTYPLEVEMAARWTKENPNVKGDALDKAMQQQPWDPSVKGLTSVPQVLAMMSEQLDWTQQLGEAFLAQPDDVTKRVQALRAKAEAAGNLKNSKELKVTKVRASDAPGPAVADAPESYIEIEPAEPDVVYVPVYDPVVVYGGWPYPARRPIYWRPPGYAYAGAFGFGAAVVVGAALWTRYDWRHRRVWIDTRRYNRFNHTRFATGAPLRWQHNPQHRGTAPYRNVRLRQEFSKGRVGPGAVPKGPVNVRGPVGPKVPAAAIVPRTPRGTGAAVVPVTPGVPAKPKATVKRDGPPVGAKPVTGPKPVVHPVVSPKPVAHPRAVGPAPGPKPVPHVAGPRPTPAAANPRPAVVRPAAAPRPAAPADKKKQ